MLCFYRLLLGAGSQREPFDHVLSILVYPSAYVAEGTEITRTAVAMVKGQARLGRGMVAWVGDSVVVGGTRAVYLLS